MISDIQESASAIDSGLLLNNVVHVFTLARNVRALDGILRPLRYLTPELIRARTSLRHQKNTPSEGRRGVATFLRGLS